MLPISKIPIAKRGWVFSLLVLFVCFLYLLLPGNVSWLKNRIFPYVKSMSFQANNMNPEFRKQYRYEAVYTYSKKIEKAVRAFESLSSEEPYVLIPSTNYFKRNRIEYVVPDPVTFYYFTGIKMVSSVYPDTQKANCYLKVGVDTLCVRSFRDNSEKSDSILSFQK